MPAFGKEPSCKGIEVGLGHCQSFFLMMRQGHILLTTMNYNKPEELSPFSDTSIAHITWDLERNT